MFKLPQEILRLIYEYDDTYKIKFNSILKEINKTVLSKYLLKLDKYIFIIINDLINRISRNPKINIFIHDIYFTKDDIDNITLYEIFIKNVDFTFIKGKKDNFHNDKDYYYKIKVEEDLYLYNMINR